MHTTRSFQSSPLQGRFGYMIETWKGLVLSISIAPIPYKTTVQYVSAFVLVFASYTIFTSVATMY